MLKFQFLFSEFRKESDRAAVILAAAMLDEFLAEILAARLVPSPSSVDPLLEGANGPLSSFSARIDACFRTGVISQRMSRDLHIVRRIRNAFAHNVLGCSFAEPDVEARVRELSNSHGIYSRSPNWLARQGVLSTREHFVIAVSGMIAALESYREDVAQLAPCREEWIYAVSLDDENEG